MSENQQTNDYKTLDVIILSFFVIFILSLSNSIFVNQIGYFGALLLILVKAFLTRKNQFSRTGLELAFALYMLAEILSLIFSEYQAQAFHFFTKRALLIPVLYTTVAVTTNLKRGKIFFTLFIVGSLITGIIYLIEAVQLYLNNHYNIDQSGPSIFQHPITASEIVSFSVLFLFAFIINEKTDWKVKLLLYSGFAISFFMLIATYKRTGWMGAGAGIILILIITRKWKILIPVFILGIVLFLMDKNVSQVSVYDFEGPRAEKLYSFNTDGRATTVSKMDSLFVICDYENGILFYKDSVLVKQIKTPAPAVVFAKVTNEIFLVQLVDTRFVILRKEGEEFNLLNEILPPGQTTTFALYGKSLYTLDSDSGLTYYESVTGESKPIRFPEFNIYRQLIIDSSNFYFINERTGISVFTKNKSLPGDEITKSEIINVYHAYFFNRNLVVTGTYGLRIYSLEDNEIILKDQLPQLKQIHAIHEQNGILALLTTSGHVFKYKVSNNSTIQLLAEDNVSPKPTNFLFSDGKLYCAYIKRGRLLSFFDPYLPQNFTRLALWRGGWEIFKDYPLFGVGDIGIEKYYVKYKRPYDKEIHGHLHNNYFHFLATLGLFGFLVLFYLFFKLFKMMAKHFKETKDKPFINSYSLGAIAALACMLVSGLTELNFWDQEIATLVYFTTGLSAALYSYHKNEAKTEAKGK